MRVLAIIDQNGNSAKVDGITGSIPVINDEDYCINNGTHFEVADIDSDVDIAGPKYWRMAAPDTSTRIHLRGIVSASNSGTVEFFEAPTIDASGTALTAVNNDRNSSEAAELLVYYDATTTDDGTRIDGGVIGTDGTNPIGGSGGQIARDDKFILKQGTEYVIKFTAVSDNTRVSLKLKWCEVSG